MAISVVAVVIVVLVVVEAGRAWVRGEVEARATAAAEARGWTVSWKALDLGYDLTLSMEDIVAEGPSDGRVVIEAIEADWKLARLIDGARTPESLSIQGVEVDIHLDAIRAMTKGDDKEKTSKKPRRSGISLRKLNATVSDTSVKVRGLPLVDTVALSGLKISGAPEGDGWRATIEGSCDEGCGEPQRLKGRLDRGRDDKVEASVAFEAPFEVKVPVPGGGEPQAVSFKSVDVVRDEGGTRVGVGEVEARAEVKGWAAQVSASRITAPLEALKDLKSPRGVRIEGPVIIVEGGPDLFDEAHAEEATPKKKKKGRRKVSRARRATEDEKKLAARVEDLRGKLARVPGLVDAILPLIEGLEVEKGELSWPARDLKVEDLDCGPEEGAYLVRGTFRGHRGHVALQKEAPYATIGVDALPVSLLTALPQARRLMEKFSPLRSVGGVLSGSVSLHNISGPVPQKKAKPTKGRKKAKRPKPKAPKTRHGFALTAHVEVKGGSLDINGLSPEPIEAQDAKVDLDVTWWPPGPGGDVIELRHLGVTLPSTIEGQSASINATATLERLLNRRTKPKVALRIWMDETDCAVAVGAIPRAMLPNIRDHLEVAGAFAPELTFSIDMKRLHSIKLAVEGLPGTCQITDLGDYSPDYLAGDFTHEVKEGVTREGIFVGPGTRSYASIKGMPMHLRVATYVSEEWNFYKNKGFDLMRTTGAVRLNLEKGRYVYGGSTITQQLVKNLFLSRDKTLSRKLEEAFIVWRMEEVLTKDRILELYLNCIEFGPNLYGITRAAGFYFGKGPARLTLLESAFLAGIKPFPWIAMGVYGRGRTPEDGYWPERLKAILGRMRNTGHISNARLESLAPYVVYFRTWRGARPKKPGQPPPGAKPTGGEDDEKAPEAPP